MFKWSLGWFQGDDGAILGEFEVMLGCFWGDVGVNSILLFETSLTNWLTTKRRPMERHAVLQRASHATALNLYPHGVLGMKSRAKATETIQSMLGRLKAAPPSLPSFLCLWPWILFLGIFPRQPITISLRMGIPQKGSVVQKVRSGNTTYPRMGSTWNKKIVVPMHLWRLFYQRAQ